MKIIKHGEMPETVSFECNFCGCIFECERGEYKVDADNAYFPPNLYHSCPECGQNCMGEW